MTNSPAMTNISNFKTQASCEVAGNIFVKKFHGFDDNPDFVCIQQ